MQNSVGSRMMTVGYRLLHPHGVVPNPRAWLGLPNTKTLNIVAQTINEALKVGPLSQQPANTGSD